MTILKRIAYGIILFFVGIFILMKLFPVDYYKNGMDNYNKLNYKEALTNFNNVESSDKNYSDAILKIKEVKPIVDSLERLEAIEKQAVIDQVEKEAELEEKKLAENKNENAVEAEVSITEPSKEKVSVIEKTKAKPTGILGSVGQSYNVGTLTYKVERVKFKKFIGGIYTLNKADGVFVILTLTVTNRNKREIFIDNSFFKLIDQSGAEYEYSPDGTASLEMSDFPGETFLGMSLNPNVTKKGKVVFEVPTKHKEYKLIFSDPFSGTFLEINMN
jgi:hypothetical protein